LETDDADKQTPNFAMNTADIALDADPAEWRCTSHFFEPPSVPYLALAVPSGSPVRVFETQEYPPVILFDIVYAGAVLHHFGAPALKDGLTTAWNNIYYPTGVEDIRAREHEISQKALSKKARAEMAAACEGPDYIDLLKTLPILAMIPRDNLEAAVREATERAEAEELRRVKEKVNEWIKTVNPG
jgi:hypothetical protein